MYYTCKFFFNRRIFLGPPRSDKKNHLSLSYNQRHPQPSDCALDLFLAIRSCSLSPKHSRDEYQSSVRRLMESGALISAVYFLFTIKNDAGHWIERWIKFRPSDRIQESFFQPTTNVDRPIWFSLNLDRRIARRSFCPTREPHRGL